jgi:hypothetical protein
MASGIRSSSSHVADSAPTYAHEGRTLLELITNLVLDKSAAKDDRRRKRVLTQFASAIMASLRRAPRAKSVVYLRDLEVLDDEQFNTVIAGLHYLRSKSRAATRGGSKRKAKQ